MVTYFGVNPDPGNSLLLDGTKSLPELTLTYHQKYFMAFTWEQFHKKWSRTWSLTRLHKFLPPFSGAYVLS